MIWQQYVILGWWASNMILSVALIGKTHVVTKTTVLTNLFIYTALTLVTASIT